MTTEKHPEVEYRPAESSQWLGPTKPSIEEIIEAEVERRVAERTARLLRILDDIEEALRLARAELQP